MHTLSLVVLARIASQSAYEKWTKNVDDYVSSKGGRPLAAVPEREEALASETLFSGASQNLGQPKTDPSPQHLGNAWLAAELSPRSVAAVYEQLLLNNPADLDAMLRSVAESFHIAIPEFCDGTPACEMLLMAEKTLRGVPTAKQRLQTHP